MICELLKMLISEFALRVPSCSEVYESMVRFSLEEVRVEFLEFFELFDVGEQEASGKPEHINI